MTESKKTNAVWTALAALLALLMGLLIGNQLSARANTGPDPCRQALSGVVEAVNTTWETASAAVDRAQNAVANQAVTECLEQ